RVFLMSLVLMSVLSFCVSVVYFRVVPFFLFTDAATSEIYPLSLHDALPILGTPRPQPSEPRDRYVYYPDTAEVNEEVAVNIRGRSEEHTSELQSRENLVCRLLLEKKNKRVHSRHTYTSEHMSQSPQRPRPRS